MTPSVLLRCATCFVRRASRNCHGLSRRSGRRATSLQRTCSASSPSTIGSSPRSRVIPRSSNACSTWPTTTKPRPTQAIGARHSTSPDEMRAVAQMPGPGAEVRGYLTRQDELAAAVATVGHFPQAVRRELCRDWGYGDSDQPRGHIVCQAELLAPKPNWPRLGREPCGWAERVRTQIGVTHD